MSQLAHTTSQTVGPFFHDCLLRPDMRRNVLAGPACAGTRIRIAGRVLDGDGAGVPDAMVELWQANAAGRYHHPRDTRDLPLDPGFLGFGRSGTDAAGAFWFETIRPGAVPFDAARMQAPHLCLAVFGRGLLNHLYTRLYFADEPANADDPILLMVPETRRATLLAQPQPGAGVVTYHLDIVLQGAGETIFFQL